MDIGDEYEFIEDVLEYADGPLEGILRRRSDNALFAFSCMEVLNSLVYHWTLVQVSSQHVGVSATLASRAVGHWVSILEDRRCLPPTLVSVSLAPEKYQPIRYSGLSDDPDDDEDPDQGT